MPRVAVARVAVAPDVPLDRALPVGVAMVNARAAPAEAALEAETEARDRRERRRASAGVRSRAARRFAKC